MKTVFVDLDNVLADYSGAFDRARQRDPDQVYPQSQYGFFARLLPIKGAVETMHAMAESDAYEPYILTAPSIYNPLCYTEKRVWVEDILGLSFVRHLIICSNKALIKGDILIDDNQCGCGQESFSGELVHFGGRQFPDWRAVREYLHV
ncbi:5' nucleotidase, NT5C type [Veronia pacifica]|nr:hypothetical protein [Veronia pacifica]